MSDTQRLTLSEIEKLAYDALCNQGFSDAQAGAIARNVTGAERDGCVSHGLFRIPFYIKALGNPSANPQAVPGVQQDETAVIHVDARNGFCPLALERGLPVLADKARQFGIAALAIHNTYNIAALWPEVETLASQNLVAMAFTAATSTVAPAGGTRPLYGTNPMAFGWPRADAPPMVFDQASSVTARGEIQLHLREGKPIPEGWALDADGNPTTDPAAALEGAQLTFGGHKGAAIALMVELLAGALIGDLFSFEASDHDVHKVGAPFGGELLLALDPARFGAIGSDPDPVARSELLFDRILAQRGTRLPSMRRYRTRSVSETQGVDVDAGLLESLRGYAAG